jgi:hypothetical protein
VEVRVHVRVHVHVRVRVRVRGLGFRSPAVSRIAIYALCVLTKCRVSVTGLRIVLFLTFLAIYCGLIFELAEFRSDVKCIVCRVLVCREGRFLREQVSDVSGSARGRRGELR